jgi:hypothetical protein
MIKTICSERQIPRNSNAGYSWSLPIFDAIEFENPEISTLLACNLSAPLYKYEVNEKKWESILELSASHVWRIHNVPFETSGVKRLLHGLWLDDNIIDAYLHLCGYLRPDIKFLSTNWFPSLLKWGLEASSKSISWVSFSFHFIK